MLQNITILNSKETKEIMQMLEKQFGIPGKLPYVFLMNKNERIFLVSREVGEINLSELRIDTLGMYFGERYKDQIRLSIEGAQLLGTLATRGIIELNRDQMLLWMKGEDIGDYEIAPELHGRFVIVRHEGDVLGCGKWRDGTLSNYVSKSRTLKTVNI